MRYYLLSLSFLAITLTALGQSTILVPQDYITIQGALNASTSGDSILVSAGTYIENIDWPSNARDVKLIGIGRAQNTIIDGSNDADEVLGIGNNLNENTLVDGFTIRNGQGGIRIVGSSPTLKNLIIENNIRHTGDRSYGGGIYISDSESLIQNCIIQNNKTSSTGWAYGAGVYATRAQITLDQCIIRDNITSGGGWSYGAGLYFQGNSFDEPTSAKVTNCTFLRNRGIGSRPYGSAIYFKNADGLELVNSVLTENFSSGSFSQSTIEFNDSDVIMTHCTHVNNRHGFTFYDSNIEIVNSILLGNGSQTIDIDDWDDSEAIISYSLVPSGLAGVGNINGDPGFLSDDLFIPINNSICLNAGDPNQSPDTDIRGNPRPLPIGSRPDIGAYEIDQDFRTILLKFFDDQNEDGIQDADEYFVGAGSVLLNGTDSYVNTNVDGTYTLDLNEGENTVSWDQTNAGLWTLTSDPSEIIVDVVGDNFIDTVAFGIRALREVKKLTSAIYAPVLVCNRTKTMEVSLVNQGTTTESGLLWLEIDERMEGFSAIETPDIIDGFKIAWEFENLVPGETIRKLVRIDVPGVNEDNLNDEYTFKSTVETPAQPQWTQEFIYVDIIRCSFDPNDKLVNPQREDDLALIDSDLIYTIRFQNVGNYHAEDVLVTDTLDNDLDMTTFQMLGTSHPEVLRLSIEDHIVNFAFNGIFLPDSTTNLEGSNGYVMYSIAADSTVVENTEVENTAHIYFDFNEAIVTNTTKNIMVSEFPIIDATKEDELLDISVFPNPSQSRFIFSEAIEKLVVFDMNGRQILKKANTRSLDMEEYLPGIYLAKIQLGEQFGIVKLVLKK